MGGHFSAQMGGAQFQVKCILDELITKDKFEIYYLTPIYDPKFKPEGYKIIKVDGLLGLQKYSSIFELTSLYKLLKEIQPDVIYQRVLGSYTGLVAYYGKHNGCKVIYHISSDYNLVGLEERGHLSFNPFNYVEHWMGDYALRNVDYVVAQTKQQFEIYNKRYGRNVSMVVPNFHPLPPDNTILKDLDVIRVLWIANFKRVKQPELFVQLASELRYIKNVEFIMMGRPGSEKIYMNLHAKIKQVKNLSYIGEQSNAEVNDLLSCAHILVNTSIVEGFSNTFIQAWMRNVPVISLSVNPDGIFDDRSIGLCSGSYEQLKRDLLELISNKSRRDEMGECARRYAELNHSIENVQKLISLMEA